MMDFDTAEPESPPAYTAPRPAAHTARQPAVDTAPTGTIQFETDLDTAGSAPTPTP